MENSRSANGVNLTERRQFERFKIVDEFLSGVIEKDAQTQIPVSILEISKGGLSFLVSREEDCVPLQAQISLRVVIKLSQAYLPCTLQVVSMERMPDGRFRHGAKLVRGSVNEGALMYLAEFVRLAQVIPNDKKSA